MFFFHTDCCLSQTLLVEVIQVLRHIPTNCRHVSKGYNTLQKTGKCNLSQFKSEKLHLKDALCHLLIHSNACTYCLGVSLSIGINFLPFKIGESETVHCHLSQSK